MTGKPRLQRRGGLYDTPSWLRYDAFRSGILILVGATLVVGSLFSFRWSFSWSNIGIGATSLVTGYFFLRRDRARLRAVEADQPPLPPPDPNPPVPVHHERRWDGREHVRICARRCAAHPGHRSRVRAGIGAREPVNRVGARREANGVDPRTTCHRTDARIHPQIHRCQRDSLPCGVHVHRT